MNFKMSAEVLRQKAAEAAKLVEADGWAFSGTDGSVSITFTFERSGDGCADGLDRVLGSGGPALVASENPRLTESAGETELARPRSWMRYLHTKFDGAPDIARNDANPFNREPFTIIEGPDAIERIEAAAHERGRLASGVATSDEFPGADYRMGYGKGHEDGYRECHSEMSKSERGPHEIDGVMELVEAAEGAAASLDSEIGPRYKFPDGHIHPAQQKQYDADVEEVATIRAAAARVREAIAAQADEPKEDR